MNQKVWGTIIVCGIISPGVGAAEPAKITSFKPPFAQVGAIERVDPKLDELIAPGTVIDKLAEGFTWSEGPVWQRREKRLLFSDVPHNIVYQWTEDEGVRVFLQPSGYTGTAKSESREPGSNGLAVDAQGNLVLCQHGDRRVSRLGADGKFVTLADRFDGKRFNSPNDLAFHPNGDLYFTDPPWGLPKQREDPTRELDFFGVFRVTPAGAVHLVSRDLFPNGIAFSPDAKRLYVANGSKIAVFDVKPDGSVENQRDLFDLSTAKLDGPDGMKVDARGNVWAAGLKGAVAVISPDGKHLGNLRTGIRMANCAFGDDGKTLYITSGNILVRVRLLVNGAGW